MKRTIIIALSVVALVFGVISYASAIDKATTVNATVGTLLQITAPSSITLESAAADKALIPQVPASTTVTVQGKSNKPATMSASVAKGTFTSLTSVTTATVTGLRGGAISVPYTVEGMVDYNVDPGAVAGTITYSLVQ